MNRLTNPSRLVRWGWTAVLCAFSFYSGHLSGVLVSEEAVREHFTRAVQGELKAWKCGHRAWMEEEWASAAPAEDDPKGRP